MSVCSQVAVVCVLTGSASVAGVELRSCVQPTVSQARGYHCHDFFHIAEFSNLFFKIVFFKSVLLSLQLSLK